jgi:uncharacterized ion transporter superfamily protein YfcC
VIAGSFHEIPEQYSLQALFWPQHSTRETTFPADLSGLATATLAGMTQAASLMIMFLGGMFGVLRASGALDAGMVRLVAATGSNVNVLAPVLMIALSAGSTFLGLISEYLVLIPMMLVLAVKLRLGRLFAVALVAIPAKIGCLASVTNALPPVIAQPTVDVPAFSGAGLRLVAGAPRSRIAYLLYNTTCGAVALPARTRPMRYRRSPLATRRSCSPLAWASSPSCTAPATCTGTTCSLPRSISRWLR